MATDDYQWVSERGNSKQQVGIIEMDILNMLSVQMNNIVKLLSRQVRVDPNSSSNVRITCCSTCG